LGTQLERTERVAKIAEVIGNELKKHQSSIDVSLAVRAAQLAKADLLTDMVGEFPELQGIMGRYYALNDKEHPVCGCSLYGALCAKICRRCPTSD